MTRKPRMYRYGGRTEERKEMPCLKCGKPFMGKRTNRICDKCAMQNAQVVIGMAGVMEDVKIS